MSPQMSDGEGTVMHHVPPNMAEILLHKRQRIRLYLLNYIIVLFLSNISCLQLCQMVYCGQLCELYFQILDHKQSRRPPPKFPIRFTPLTGTCTHILKQAVHYYRQWGSHVFYCFIDFSKAFDNVDYWLLFCKLLDYNKSNSCLICVWLLAYWYNHQHVYVRWQSCHSACFNIANGVRQGGMLSPFLFRVYIRELINSVDKSKIGCYIAGVCVNLLAYADDIVLLSPSWHGLQKLLNIIEKAATAVDMSINTNKTVCMVAKSYMKSKIVCTSFPQLSLANCKLSFVSQFKYLGHIIENTFCDDNDII